MSRQEAIQFLCKYPAKFGHAVGFKKLGELHNDWIIFMRQNGTDRTIQGHRESYKTTCVAIAIAIDIILTPNLKTLFIRKTATDTIEIVKQVTKILKHPTSVAIIQEIWGKELKFVKESGTEISTNLSLDTRGTAQLVGIGISGSLTGKHFDRIRTDDIVTREDRVSPAERNKTKLIYQELHNIVMKEGGFICNTGTPWHKEDAFTIMPKPILFDVYSTGIIPPEKIETLKASMTASLFAANYELKHIASDEVMFPYPDKGHDAKMAYEGWGHVDAAYYGEDYTAFTICAKHDGEYYVFGKLWRKHVDDCMNAIIEYRKAFGARRISCEKNGDKGYFANEMRKRGEYMYGYSESENKHMKISTFLKGNWKKVHFVQGTDEEYISQIENYTEFADHDDAPDSLASIIRELEKKVG